MTAPRTWIGYWLIGSFGAGVVLLAGCGGKAEVPAASIDAASPVATTPASLNSAPLATPAAAKVAPKPARKAVDPVVVLHTTLGDIKLQLHAEKAPETVENFIRNYAERGFYDNTIVHHVQPGSMVLFGGYLADLQARDTRTPIRNESFNGLKNERGMVAMTRNPEYADSATSQFFINLGDNPGLDYATTDAGDPLPGYCVFGKVIEGMDIVDRIAALPCSPSGPFEQVPAGPTGPVTIQTVEQVR